LPVGAGPRNVGLPWIHGLSGSTTHGAIPRLRFRFRFWPWHRIITGSRLNPFNSNQKPPQGGSWSRILGRGTNGFPPGL
jgi:hypothetical protein